MHKKILIVKLGAIGDVIHTTTIQQTVKKKHPNVEICFLTANNIAPLLENDPNLLKVFAFDMKKKDNFFYLLKLGIELRKENFDTVILLQKSIRTFFLNFIINPSKVVYRSNSRIHAIDAFVNSAKEIFPDIERPSDLKLFLSEEKITAVKEKFQNYKRPFFVISPGGENDTLRQGRIWPLENWADLAKKFIHKYGGTVFVTGSKAEREYHSILSQIDNVFVISGDLKLDESAALFSLADLFIAGDSGPLHIASALDIPVLGIMGSTSPVACSPYGSKCSSVSKEFDCLHSCNKICHVDQNSTYKPCITAISVQEVLDAIEKIEFSKN